MTSPEVQRELERILRKQKPQKPDVWGRRPALPSEIQRTINPAKTPEVETIIRRTPAHKPGVKDGR